MTNLEYIFLFAEKHNFPKTNCEVFYKTTKGNSILANDDDIISIKFDQSLVENEIRMEDIRFDIDSNFPEDVFEIWQKDDPSISFKTWISMGRYVPTIIQNAEYFDELESLTKEIQMKLESIFSAIEEDGDSDYDEEDSDYYEEDEDGEE
jgi:hypothetical protein